MLIITLSFLWFIRETKAVLFWLYLWQLKEYRIPRFLDHFRTEKGRQLLLNKICLLKLLFLFIFIYWYLVADDLTLEAFISLFGLLVIYSIEDLKILKDFFQRRIKTPVFTKKIIFLLSFIGLILAIFLYFIFHEDLNLVISIVAFDLFTPIIISSIVLLFQPLAILGRNQIIKRAIRKREQFKNLLVIGITGSYGKTSTKEFLYAILSEKFNVLKTKEHQNTEMGVSQCVLNNLKPEHQIFIVEMGAYCQGEIKLLCDITKPKIGILTGISEQHLALFGSLDNIIRAKFELIENLPADGTAFFNARNRYCVELYQKTPHQNKFGTGQAKIKKFLYGENVELSGLENIEGAKMVARELGMTDGEISKALEKIENKFAGIQFKKGINGLKVIDATYSANPDGVIAHLEYLKTLRQAQGKLVVVMPCLIELGKATIEVHKRIGQKIGEVCDLSIITTKERFKEIKEGAASAKALASQVGEKVLFLENPKEIFEKIKNFCKEGDVVLLESRVPSQLISLLLQ